MPPLPLGDIAQQTKIASQACRPYLTEHLTRIDKRLNNLPSRSTYELTSQEVTQACFGQKPAKTIQCHRAVVVDQRLQRRRTRSHAQLAQPVGEPLPGLDHRLLLPLHV